MIGQIRRFCKLINYELALNNGKKKNMVDDEIKAIHKWLNSETPHKYNIGGYLGKIIAKRDHPQRASVVWCNFFYGSRKKNKVNIPSGFGIINPTQILHPEYFEEYDKLVQFPKEVRKYFSTDTSQQTKGKK